MIVRIKAEIAVDVPDNLSHETTRKLAEDTVVEALAQEDGIVGIDITRTDRVFER